MTSTEFVYKGYVSCIEDLPSPEGRCGDVYCVKKDSYASIGDKWELIAEVSDLSCNKNEKISSSAKHRKIVRTKCESCGAPLRAIFEFEDTCKCSYCGTTNVIAEWIEAKAF